MECPKCPIKEIGVKELRVNDTKFCSFSLILTVNNSLSSSFPVTVTSPNNEVILDPSGFAILPGNHSYLITVIPIGTFNGGLVHLLLNGVTLEGQPCSTDFEVELPACRISEVIKVNSDVPFKLTAASLVLVPNPAQEYVVLNYQAMELNSEVLVYDLTGRLLNSLTLTATHGTTVLDVSDYPVGVYVVVVQNKNGWVMQQKLIKE